MIRANRQTLPLWFFTGYFRLLQTVLFRRVQFLLMNPVPEGPVLLIQNHFSWWDGYWSYHVAEKMLNRRFHVMMLESELKKRRFLARTGVFSIDPEGRNLVAGMRYAAGLLDCSDNLVTVYPQGKIQSHYLDHLRFEKGTEVLLRMCREPVHVVFVSSHTGFGSPVRPEARIFVSYFGTGKFTVRELEGSFNLFHTECRKQLVLSET